MIREVQPGEGALVAEVLHELRPHRRVDEIPALVDAQRTEGYRVVGSFVDDVVVAAAGFRLSTNLALGRAIYIDDLVTLPRAALRNHWPTEQPQPGGNPCGECYSLEMEARSGCRSSATMGPRSLVARGPGRRSDSSAPSWRERTGPRIRVLGATHHEAMPIAEGALGDLGVAAHQLLGSPPPSFGGGPAEPHAVEELALMYAAQLTARYLDMFVKMTERPPGVALADRDRIEELVALGLDRTAHLWFLTDEPHLYDRGQELLTRVAGTREFRPSPTAMADAMAIPPDEVRYYRNPLDRLRKMHQGGVELTTGFSYVSPWA